MMENAVAGKQKKGEVNSEKVRKRKTNALAGLASFARYVVLFASIKRLQLTLFSV